MFDLTTVTGVQQYMRGATSESDWNDRCDKVKDANNGYPDFWFTAIMMSRLASQVMSKF